MSIILGADYDLYPGPRPCASMFFVLYVCNGPDPVYVSRRTPTSFTFHTLPGHIAGAGNDIAFTTYTVGAGEFATLYLRNEAFGYNEPWLDKIPLFGDALQGSRKAIGRETWRRMAENLAREMRYYYLASELRELLWAPLS